MSIWGEAAPIALTDAERFDWLRLTRCENIGPRTFRVLVERHGGAGAALDALPELIRQGKPGRPIRIFSVEETEQELAAMQSCGAVFVGMNEPDYPALLRRIDSSPPLLAVRGDLTSLRRSKIAIVGSRNASAAGLAFTEQLARGIARAGHVIVSGLARGIDARAHQATIGTGTIAVLAGGLGNLYPAEHAPLLERLIEHGAAISEMPFGWEPRGRDFPRRNRIVSGLAHAIVVVEAARGSGSLWTAKFANEQGREIFAVPGSPLDPRAEGTNDLLRDGANICTKAEDVIDALTKRDLSRQEPLVGFSEAELVHEDYEPLWDELNLAEVGALPQARAWAEPLEEAPRLDARRLPAPLDSGGAVSVTLAARTLEDLTSQVTELLGPTPVSVDEIVRASKAQAREVRTVLTNLHLAGRLEWHGGDLVSLLSKT